METNSFVAYEVIRIINSKPLFAKDHYQRLICSVNFYNSKIRYSYNSFIELCKICIEENNIKYGNIKIELDASTANSDFQLNYKQIPHNYPSMEQYRYGVKTKTFNHERIDPNNKIWNEKLRVLIDKFIVENDIYEALYVNDLHCLTEGSRSNLFFINGNLLYSAKPQDILQGITKKHIEETARNLGLNLIEKDISIKEISNYDAAFISGTSPKILPIMSIDSFVFNPQNDYLQKLILKFNQVIEKHIEEFEF